jgi:hypothetical protein
MSKINSDENQVQLYSISAVALIYDSASTASNAKGQKKSGEILIRNSRENLRALIPGLRPAKERRSV